MPVAGFDAIFDWYLSMLGCFIYFHIVKSTQCNKSYKGLGFLFVISRQIFRFNLFSYCSVNFNVDMAFFSKSSHVINRQ